jgi:hypothetical protein
MREPRPRHAEPGHAAVEYLAIIGIVVTMTIGLTLWFRSAIPEPASAKSPSIVTRSLDRLVAPVDPPKRAMPTKEGRLRRIVRIARRGVRIAGRGGRAFLGGFGGALRRDLDALIADPVGTLFGGGGEILAILRDPAGAGIALVRAAREYAAELRALSPQEAYERLLRDLGEGAEDALLNRGRKTLLKKLRERVQEPATRSRPKPPPEAAARSP